MREKPCIYVSLVFKATSLFFILLTALWWTGSLVAAQHASLTLAPRVVEQGPLSAEQVAQIMTEVSQFPWDGVQLSPDGAWVAYSVTRKSVTTNESTTEWLLQRVPQGGDAVPAPGRLPSKASAVRWCPDSRCLSMIIETESAGTRSSRTFVRYDIATGEMAPIPVRDTSAAAGSPGHRPRVTMLGSNYIWSPRGTYIAFRAPLATGGGLDPRRGVPPKEWKIETCIGLFVLEVATGTVTQLTPDSLQGSVFTFDWAPDERLLAVTVVEEGHDHGSGSDLIVVDRASGAVRPLVTQPGMDTHPKWSPDGRWIAFATQNGESSREGLPAAVPAEGGTVMTFPKNETPSTEFFGGAWWSPDSRAFYYGAGLEMTSRFVRADVASRVARPLSVPAGNLPLPYDTHRSLSADSRLMAYKRESMTTPPEVFVVALDAEGHPTGTPRQLTRLTPDFPLSKLVHTEKLSWSSPDGKFTIHGLLLTPASAWSGGRLNAPLPTLLHITGGPGMVRRDFDEWYGARLALAARGYAVLDPNTRGRGGYGEAFAKGIRDGRSRYRLPAEDAMAGIDVLIKRGIADPDKLGVLGHSYGGALTSYIITQTDRFKGAVNYEGSSFEIVSRGAREAKDTFQDRISLDLFGIHDPFDSADRARLIAESAGLNADRVKTPTLLQFGVNSSNAERAGLPLLNGLRRFKYKSALFVYDEGHVFVRPAARADNLTRTGEWLDYWVRRIPFPDAGRAKEYNEWRSETKKELKGSR